MSQTKNYVYIAARLAAAVILLQTLYFKFGGHDESIYIFTKIEMEPQGRYLTGTIELIASVLLLIPATSWIGGIIGIGLMLGAVFMHFTLLGIEVQNDGGYLFVLACIVLFCCAYVVWYKRERIQHFLPGKK